jgi:hypothetical protein
MSVGYERTIRLASIGRTPRASGSAADPYHFDPVGFTRGLKASLGTAI